MSRSQVNIITAFGRAEDLALQLEQSGWLVRVFDFTDAFPEIYHRGAGPFPIARGQTLAGALPQVKALPSGLTFWLKDGPLELAGPLADVFNGRPEVRVLRSGVPAAVYKHDWLRRLVRQMAAATYFEAWEMVDGPSPFPFDRELGIIPSFAESARFERFRATGQPLINAAAVKDLRAVGHRLTEIVIESGQTMAFGADQWVWCLSSAETARLNADLAMNLFMKQIAAPAWVWASWSVDCAHGPWHEGLPEHIFVIGDPQLPFVYGNFVVLAKDGGDRFRVWLRVPASLVDRDEARARWLAEVDALLNERLGLAKWAVDARAFVICPHSPVFDQPFGARPKWKNWDWIAPETMARLDWGARLEREASALKRMTAWRADQLKKQGDSSDPALHAP